MPDSEIAELIGHGFVEISTTNSRCHRQGQAGGGPIQIGVMWV
jgi:hypothetical protein